MLPIPAGDVLLDPVERLVSSRPTLRPGCVAVRRDTDHLQVGVDPPHRVVLSDVPAVREVLACLRRGERPPVAAPEARDALDALLRADLIVDAALLESSRGALAAAAYGRAGAERFARRASAHVEVRADGASTSILGRLLDELGCPVPVGSGGPGSGRPDVVVVAEAGPIPRSRLDDLVREHVPHLLVSASAYAVSVGPLALAGVTACVRCVDAHLGEADPRRGVVWEQVSHLAAAPADPALWAMALGWAARDVVSFVDGDTPSTWSATVRLAPGAMPERTPWLRHPHCGCTWGDRS